MGEMEAQHKLPLSLLWPCVYKKLVLWTFPDLLVSDLRLLLGLCLEAA